jgi:GntR family transcriptional regulator/MocR family aminotransferase
MRRIYGERRQLVLQLLREDFAKWLEPIESAYGMHVTAISNGTIDVDAVARRLLGRNIRIRNLRRYYFGEEAKAGLVFGLGAIDSDAIRRAMGIIRETMEAY